MQFSTLVDFYICMLCNIDVEPNELLYVSVAIGGFLVDRFGCRVVGIFGTTLVCIGYFLSGFATHLVHLYITFSLITGRSRLVKIQEHCGY